MIFDGCGTDEQKQCRVATIKKACLTLDKDKTPLNQFNKTSNKGEYI